MALILFPSQVPLNDSNTMSVIEFSLSEVLSTIDHSMSIALDRVIADKI